MNNAVKPTLGILALCLASPSLLAIDIDKKNGTLNASIKAMTILGGDDNGYDPNDGTSYLLKVKYQTPKKNKLKFGIGLYNAGDLINLTNFNTERVARGMFVTDDGSQKSQIGELYLDYGDKKHRVYGGRMT